MRGLQGWYRAEAGGAFFTSDGTPFLYELTEEQATGYRKTVVWAIASLVFVVSQGSY